MSDTMPTDWDLEDDKPPRSGEEARRSIAESAEPDSFDAVPDQDIEPEELLEFEREERENPGRRTQKVKWAEDRDQPDFAHLLVAEKHGIKPDKTFALTPQALELLIKANHFEPVGPNGKFVIAVRGGLLANGKKQVEDVTSVELEDRRPDHRKFRCTLGYYDRKNGLVTAYLGSTVPNAYYVDQYFRGQRKSNLLPTGCYVFRKNAHSKGRIKPALRMTNPDKLTLDALTTVLRSRNNAVFEHGDIWDKTTPYDNVHCAYYNNKFSSAGCLTIQGADRAGPWGRFQKELDKHKWDTRIDVLLLTGREVAIAAKIIEMGRANDDDLVRACLERIRYGSQGEVVSALQRKLGFSGNTAYFGPSTRVRLVEAERRVGSIASDSIYSPADDAEFGWGLFSGSQPATGTGTGTGTTPSTQPPPPPTGPEPPPPTTTRPTGIDPSTLVLVASGAGMELAADGKTLTVAGEGVWTIGPQPGKITFTPEPGFSGRPRPVRYQVSDVHGNTATAEVKVNVLSVNKAPVIVDDEARTIAGMPVTIAVLRNDTDADGQLDPDSVRFAVAPSQMLQVSADRKILTVDRTGTWTVAPGTGEINFAPVAGYVGTTSAVYEVTDDGGTTGRANVTVTVAPAPVPPKLGDDEAETEEGKAVTIDVLANDETAVVTPQPDVTRPPITPVTPAQPEPPTTGEPATEPPAEPPAVPTTTPGPASGTAAVEPDETPPISGVVHLTEADLRRFAPRAKDKYINALVNDGDQVLAAYGINYNAERLCHFMAQIGHESGGFTIDRESLYYTSAKRLMRVWPKRFRSVAAATPYLRNEEKLAARVYDGRVRDLGNTQPGDGYKYRGRGLIQITGRGGYRDIGRKIKVDLEGNPDLAIDGVTALKIAGQTWYDRTRKQRTMNQLAEDNKIDIITLRINGGYTNLDQRKQDFRRAWAIWGKGAAPSGPKNKDLLERGQRGKKVREMQDALINAGYLEAPSDGRFGPNTQKGVMRFQHKNDMNVNGIVDRATLAAILAAPPVERRRRGDIARDARDPRQIDKHSGRRGQSAAWTGVAQLAAVILGIAALAIICGLAVSGGIGSGGLSGTPSWSIGLLVVAILLWGGAWFADRRSGAPAGGGARHGEAGEGTRSGDQIGGEGDETRDLLGSDVPLHKLGFDEEFFYEPEPIRSDRALSEDVEIDGTGDEDTDVPADLSFDDGFGEPGTPGSADTSPATAQSALQPYPVSDGNVDLVLIKMFGGDNNLTAQVDRDLGEVATGIEVGDARIGVIALVDYEGKPGSIVEVSPSGQRHTVASLGEIDTGNPETLARFLSRAIVTYPNARKALGFWDHGTGTFDEDDPDEQLLTRQIRGGARRAVPARRLLIPSAQREAWEAEGNTRAMLHDNSGGVLTTIEAGRMIKAAFMRAGFTDRFDLIYSDTCLNGMAEVTEELSPYARCIVASCDTEPGAGWAYDRWMDEINYAYPQDAAAWGRTAVVAFGDHYKGRHDQYPCTLAAFDADNDIAETFTDMVQAAETAGSRGRDLLRRARDRTQLYDRRDSFDLIHFAENLRDLADGEDNTLHAAATALERAARQARILSVAHGPKVKQSMGIAFWFPGHPRSFDDDARTYRRLQFSQITGWADYLENDYFG